MSAALDLLDQFRAIGAEIVNRDGRLILRSEAQLAAGLGAVLSGRGKRNDIPVRTIRERVPVPVPTGRRREEGVLSGGWH